MKRDGHSAKRKILPLFLCLLLSLTMVPTVALAEDGRSGDIPSGNVSAAGDGAKGGALAGPDAQGGSSDGAEGEDIGGSGDTDKEGSGRFRERIGRGFGRLGHDGFAVRQGRRRRSRSGRRFCIWTGLLCSCAGRQGLARCGRSFRFAERGGTPSSANRRRGIPSGCIVACSQRFPRHSILHGHHRAANESLYRAVGGGRSG